ncbi:MAG: tRNA (adenosine(37)-N6)-threonylcarbamoyltransferase complex transferase subunit TsaD [Candidatus Cloacimonadota bacterium]|nr:MAG: tRNA (adenosine(37)-N6)-threonylcarbamoyltransferase complex transferase subunit TsaD [Candidatus Cloacimonadota bacterium]
MLILGIETSCDETAAAVVKDGKEILSNVIYSQDIHSEYGGVVPELASRDHVKNIIPVVRKSLRDAGVSLAEIDAVAVTQSPGLIGSLLIGLSFAKSLSFSLDIPLVAVNHLEGHIYANFLTYPELEPPLLGLIVSGGHTDLLIIEERGKYLLLGSTLDDACGEAFDKVANLLGLSYPGGPEIEKITRKGNPNAIPFPPGRVKGYDFSFSGLKTAVLYYLRKLTEEEKEKQKTDIAASFQMTAVRMLVKKSLKAMSELKIMRLAVSGGVAANKRLRDEFSKQAKKKGFDVYFPDVILCTDNAVMIAACGYDHYKKGDISSLTIKAEPTETIY